MESAPRACLAPCSIWPHVSAPCSIWPHVSPHVVTRHQICIGVTSAKDAFQACLQLEVFIVAALVSLCFTVIILSAKLFYCRYFKCNWGLENAMNVDTGVINLFPRLY